VREATALESSQSTTHQQAERLAAIIGGATLIAYAAKDRSWRSIPLALAGAPLVWRGATGHWPVPQALTRHTTEAEPAEIEANVTINRPRQELYDFWHRFENLPQFMRHVESVEVLGDGRSRWVARSPLGRPVEWEAEIVDDQAGRLLSWRSLPGSQVQNAGTVLFEEATGGRGTMVTVQMEAGPAGNGLGRLLGRALSPITRQQVQEDLRRFKNLMEAGEIPTTEGQPAGHRSPINLHNPL
jgi:uncharacterized membrane protein